MLARIVAHGLGGFGQAARMMRVTIASGLDGGLARRFAADRVPTGGSVWTFALMPD